MHSNHFPRQTESAESDTTISSDEHSEAESYIIKAVVEKNFAISEAELHRESVESQARDLVLEIVATIERVESAEVDVNAVIDQILEQAITNAQQKQLIEVDSIAENDSNKMGQLPLKPKPKEPERSDSSNLIEGHVENNVENIAEGISNACNLHPSESQRGIEATWSDERVSQERNTDAKRSEALVDILFPTGYDDITPSIEEYHCKVLKTEYDIIVAETIEACASVATDNNELSIIDQIVPSDGLVDDTTIPKAILISTKPAMVALDLASATESTADAKIHERVDEDSASIHFQIIDDDQSTVETILHQIPGDFTSLEHSESDTFVTASDTTPDVSAEPAASELSPLKIPLVLVSESEPTVLSFSPSPKPLTKQSSLEIPPIEYRENYNELRRPHVPTLGTTTASRSFDESAESEENESDFVIITQKKSCTLFKSKTMTKTPAIWNRTFSLAPLHARPAR